MLLRDYGQSEKKNQVQVMNDRNIILSPLSGHQHFFEGCPNLLLKRSQFGKEKEYLLLQV